MIETLARPVAGSPARVAVRAPACPWLRSRYFGVGLVTLVLPFICLAGRPLYGDIWWVLANARVLVQRGSLPTADPFTFAPHAPAYVDAQWLAQLAYYGAYQILGLPGVSIFNALALTLGFGLLLHLGWRRSTSAPAAVLANLAAVVVAMPYLHPRAQALALPLFAATMWLLAGTRPGARRVVAVGLVEAAWANVHGSFFVGPPLTLAYLAGEVSDAVIERRWRWLARSRRLQFLTLALGAQVAGSLLNPYGAGLYGYALRLTGDPAIRQHVTEWFPTAATDLSQTSFFASVALAGTVVAAAQRRVRLADLFPLVLFAALGLQAIRNIPWWAMAATPITASYLAEVPPPLWLVRLGGACLPKRERVRANLVLATVLALIIVAALPWVRAANPLVPAAQRSPVDATYPLGAIDFLRTHQVGSHLFQNQPWGGYVDWALWPSYTPMVDSAIEVHPTEVWLDTLAINQGHTFWQDLLDRYGVDVLLLSRDEQAPLIEAVERSPRWQRVYQDQQAAIYVPASLGTPSR